MSVVYDIKKVKLFNNIKIDISILEELIRSGMYAITLRNVTPWHFIALTQRDFFKTVKLTVPIVACNQYIVILGDTECEPNLEFLKNDLAFSTYNIIIRAKELGLDSFFTYCFHIHEEHRLIHDFLKLPKNIIVYGIIAVGYAKEKGELEIKYFPDKMHINSW